jgi:dipeptidyl aminopeptidase/acylaminoacyl peptidase
MSFTGTADIPGFIPDFFGGEFWDDLAAYREHSPVFNVKGVTTPTLIQHGEDDVRVPLGQGRELYNALKRQDVPVKMVIYPRQGHRIDEPRLRIDMRKRAVAWLERWLLGSEEA